MVTPTAGGRTLIAAGSPANGSGFRAGSPTLGAGGRRSSQQSSSPTASASGLGFFGSRRGSIGTGTASPVPPSPKGGPALAPPPTTKLQEVLNPISLRRMSHSVDFFTPMMAFAETQEES
jgi:hypothetical protein